MDGITGLIFADEYNFDIPGVSVKRALAAVPFGARYRVIDFTLSNMMNAGIKNMGIIHNREFETGSLRIDLHDENDVRKAAETLEAHGYPVTIG